MSADMPTPSTSSALKTPQPKRRKKTDDATEEDKDAESKRKQEAKVLRYIESKASKIVNAYRQQVMTAKCLAERIQGNDAWKWARGEDNIGQLEACLQQLDQSMHHNTFVMDMASMDVKDVKKSYGVEFNMLVRMVEPTLHEPIENLMKICRRLNNMHKANIND